MTRLSPLENRPFRSLLLVIAGVPITLLYIWRTLVQPALTGILPLDFSANYMAAAASIAAGRDPYDLCVIQGCANQAQTFTPLPLAGAQYVTPLPVAWMLQPLVGADPRIQLAVVIAVLQISLLVFLLAAIRASAVADWQLAALLVLMTISFEPVAGNFDEGQVNLVLLALSGVWLLAWVAGDRWWGGVALGAAVAIKLLQAPSGPPAALGEAVADGVGRSPRWLGPMAAVRPPISARVPVQGCARSGRRYGAVRKPLAWGHRGAPV